MDAPMICKMMSTRAPVRRSTQQQPEGKIIRQFELKVTADDAMSHVKQVLASRYAQYGLPMEDEMLTEFAKKTLSNKEEAKNVYDFLYEEKIIALVKEKCSLQENYLPYEEFIHKVQHS